MRPRMHSCRAPAGCAVMCPEAKMRTACIRWKPQRARSGMHTLRSPYTWRSCMCRPLRGGLQRPRVSAQCCMSGSCPVSKSHCFCSKLWKLFIFRTLCFVSEKHLDRAACNCVHSTALLSTDIQYLAVRLDIGRVAEIEWQALLAAAGQQVCKAEDACAPCGAALAGPSVTLTFSYDYFEAAVLHSEFEVMPVLLRVPPLAQRCSTAVSSCLITH